jgi:hypothetical protein
MSIRLLLILFGLMLPATALAQSTWNQTFRPDDVAVARLLGYLSGIESRCRNLEVDGQIRASFLERGNVSLQDLDKGGRLRQHFEDQERLALQQDLDSECAMVLSTHRGILRLRPGEPEPKGSGFIGGQTIKPMPWWCAFTNFATCNRTNSTR